MLGASKPKQDVCDDESCSLLQAPPLADAVARLHEAEGIPLHGGVSQQSAVVPPSPRLKEEPPSKVRRHSCDADVTSPRSQGSSAVQVELGGPPRQSPAPRRLLHVFSGPDRPGGLCDAARALGCTTHAVDIAIDPVRGDILNDNVYHNLLHALMQKQYDVVWLGPVCSSVSRLRGRGDGPPRVRSRAEPMGMSTVGPEWRAYLRKHNEFVFRTVALATTAFQCGATFVIEHPLDRGQLGSPYFLWDARPHASLWVTPPVVQLVRSTRAEYIHFPQCAVGSPFQKLTTLLSAGPAAGRLLAMSRLRCEHQVHAALAAGFDAEGRARSAEAAAYPPLMSATVASLLLTEEPVGDVLWRIRSRAATRLHHVMMHQRRCLALAERPEAGSASQRLSVAALLPPLRMPILPGDWLSAPRDIPLSWPERMGVFGEACMKAREEALRYLSRRRAEPESPVELVLRPLPLDGPPSLTRATESSRPAGGLWPVAAPPRPVHISQLFLPGAYRMQR